jgi:anti-sigma-K factor RskA
MSDGADRMQQHEAMLDVVATYALGALGSADAARVRAHLRDCETCRKEYESFASTTVAIAASAEGSRPSELLKAQIMRAVRAEAAPQRRAAGTIVWPAYLVAAACFALAVALSLYNLSLIEQLHGAQTQLAQIQERSSGLVHDLGAERSTLADLMDETARRYDVAGGQIVLVRNHVYITMHDMPQPPKGKVYQAWTLPKGSKSMVPAQTFLPDVHGVAVVALPVQAEDTAAVAVSIEPDGGSKQPTSKPLVVQELD